MSCLGLWRSNLIFLFLLFRMQNFAGTRALHPCPLAQGVQEKEGRETTYGDREKACQRERREIVPQTRIRFQRQSQTTSTTATVSSSQNPTQTLYYCTNVVRSYNDEAKVLLHSKSFLQSFQATSNELWGQVELILLPASSDQQIHSTLPGARVNTISRLAHRDQWSLQLFTLLTGSWVIYRSSAVYKSRCGSIKRFKQINNLLKAWADECIQIWTSTTYVL